MKYNIDKDSAIEFHLTETLEIHHYRALDLYDRVCISQENERLSQPMDGSMQLWSSKLSGFRATVLSRSLTKEVASKSVGDLFESEGLRKNQLLSSGPSADDLSQNLCLCLLWIGS